MNHEGGRVSTHPILHRECGLINHCYQWEYGYWWDPWPLRMQIDHYSCHEMMNDDTALVTTLYLMSYHDYIHSYGYHRPQLWLLLLTLETATMMMTGLQLWSMMQHSSHLMPQAMQPLSCHLPSPWLPSYQSYAATANSHYYYAPIILLPQLLLSWAFTWDYDSCSWYY